MNDLKLNEILDLLIEATMIHRLEWKMVGSERFSVNLATRSVEIEHILDFVDETDDYKISFCNSQKIKYAEYHFSTLNETVSKKIQSLYNMVIDEVFEITLSDNEISSYLKNLVNQ